MNLQKHLKGKHVDEAKKCFGDLEVGKKDSDVYVFKEVSTQPCNEIKDGYCQVSS